MKRGMNKRGALTWQKEREEFARAAIESGEPADVCCAYDEAIEEGNYDRAVEILDAVGGTLTPSDM